MGMTRRLKLGQFLISKGLLKPEQLASALAEQERWGSRLGVTLIRLGYIEEEMLVDAGGTVIVHQVHEGMEAAAAGLHGGQAIDLNPLPFPEIVDAIRRGDAGFVEIDDPQHVMVAYYPVEALGWYYVVVADADAMMAEVGS